MPGALRLLACLKSRARFYLPLFFERFMSSQRPISLIVNGVPVAQLVLYLEILLISASEPFLSAARLLILPHGLLYWKYCVWMALFGLCFL